MSEQVFYRYGLMYRPVDISTVPKGWLSHEAAPEYAKHVARHGVVVYGTALTTAELKQFELAELLDVEGDSRACVAVVAELGEYAGRYAARWETSQDMVKNAIMSALDRCYGHRVVLLDERNFCLKVIQSILDEK